MQRQEIEKGRSVWCTFHLLFVSGRGLTFRSRLFLFEVISIHRSLAYPQMYLCIMLIELLQSLFFLIIVEWNSFIIEAEDRADKTAGGGRLRIFAFNCLRKFDIRFVYLFGRCLDCVSRSNLQEERKRPETLATK
jgi:hypothetical protein